MKKTVVFFVLLAIILGNAFCGGSKEEVKSAEMLTAESLIKDGVKKNSDEIIKIVGNFSIGEKDVLYSNTKKPIAGPIIYNLVPGFGLGSFQQKDYISGTIGLVSDAAALGIFIYSNYKFKEYYDNIDPSLPTNEIYSSFKEKNEEIDEIMHIALYTFLASKVFQIIMPAIFGTIQNNTLKDVIYAEPARFAVVPTYVDGNMAITAVASISY